MDVHPLESPFVHEIVVFSNRWGAGILYCVRGVRIVLPYKRRTRHLLRDFRFVCSSAGCGGETDFTTSFAVLVGSSQGLVFSLATPRLHYGSRYHLSSFSFLFFNPRVKTDSASCMLSLFGGQCSTMHPAHFGVCVSEVVDAGVHINLGLGIVTGAMPRAGSSYGPKIVHNYGKETTVRMP